MTKKNKREARRGAGARLAAAGLGVPGMAGRPPSARNAHRSSVRANDGLRVDESAPRRLLRCWTLALAAALLALAGAAQAQDQTVVENLAQGGNQVLELNRVAQTFETGPNTGGYTVTHVTLRANAAPHPAGTSSTVRAMLCNVDSSGKPPDNLGFCTWTGTVRFFDAGNLDFELERSVRLLPNTKYAVVAQRTASANPPLSATGSGSADSASSAGWDIGAGGQAWEWKMTKRQNGTFHERWERDRLESHKMNLIHASDRLHGWAVRGPPVPE